MLIPLYRFAHWCWVRRIPLLPRLLSLTNRVVFATVLPASAKLGKNVQVAYSGLGTVIHARAVIGSGVSIGFGAKVLGPIRVGRGAVIGANAVVIHDVPAGAVVVGIPAKVIRTLGDTAA